MAIAHARRIPRDLDFNGTTKTMTLMNWHIPPHILEWFYGIMPLVCVHDATMGCINSKI